MLELENINVYYGEFRVLKNISLKVEPKELVAVLGPNGHGKSTLLKTICGLINPESGSIRYDGVEISHLSTEQITEMGIVYIAEDRNLFPDMTVMENLRLGAYNKNARKPAIVKRNLEFVFEFFPRLKEWSKRKAGTLSGGEARMCAIGTGLMAAPKFIAIDEPSLGLAPIIRTDVFSKIAEINNTGTSVLLVEQNVVESARLIERSYIIDDGKIVFEGTKDEMFNNDHVMKVFLGA